MNRGLAALLAVLLAPSALLAADPQLPVPIQSAQGVKYYNGGVGIDERKELPQVFPLKVVLATDTGLYLNDAEVVITAAGGAEVLRVRAARGPWLVADVPAGSYTVEATLEGRSARSRVSVPAGGKSVTYLRWKTSEIDMGL